MFQISDAYSCIVRSLEKRLILATLRIALLLQAKGFAETWDVFPERSVIAFTSMAGKTLASLAEDWASVANASHLHGTVSLFSGGKFHSFTFSPNGYHLGSLDNWAALQYWVRRYYWLSPVLIFACMWLLTLFCHRWLEDRATARLQIGS
jgi:hypothetical protein